MGHRGQLGQHSQDLSYRFESASSLGGALVPDALVTVHKTVLLVLLGRRHRGSRERIQYFAQVWSGLPTAPAMADRSYHDYQLLSSWNDMGVQLQSSGRLCR